MGGRHAVTFAVHFYDSILLDNRSCDGITFSCSRRTFRPLLLDRSLEQEIQRLTAHLADEHQKDLDFAAGPYQRHVNNAESLRYKGEPGAEVGEVVGRVLSRGKSQFTGQVEMVLLKRSMTVREHT